MTAEMHRLLIENLAVPITTLGTMRHCCSADSRGSDLGSMSASDVRVAYEVHQAPYNGTMPSQILLKHLQGFSCSPGTLCRTQ
jgi:hypothetical protein